MVYFKIISQNSKIKHTLYKNITHLYLRIQKQRKKEEIYTTTLITTFKLHRYFNELNDRLLIKTSRHSI